MSKYRRSTRECAVIQLKPNLLRSLQEYFKSHHFGDLETECLVCCETISEKQSSNWFSDWLDAGADEVSYSAIVLTDRRLVWARAAAQAEGHSVGAELMNINAGVHFSWLTKDIGLMIAGLVEDSKGNVRGVIGMGPEPAALNFCETVHAAIEKVNPTPKRKWPAWMGGSKE
jgi:hypothetical protein